MKKFGILLVFTLVFAFIVASIPVEKVKAAEEQEYLTLTQIFDFFGVDVSVDYQDENYYSVLFDSATSEYKIFVFVADKTPPDLFYSENTSGDQYIYYSWSGTDNNNRCIRVLLNEDGSYTLSSNSFCTSSKTKVEFNNGESFDLVYCNFPVECKNIEDMPSNYADLCNLTFDDDVVEYANSILGTDSHEHSYSVANCTTPATCSCGATTGDINTENHAGSMELFGNKEATEFEDGYTGDTICSSCGVAVVIGEVIPATGSDSGTDIHEHIYSVADCTTPATCSCGATTGVRDTENHSGSMELFGYKEATEFEDGYTGDTICSSCGVAVVIGEVIPATGSDSDIDTDDDTGFDSPFWEVLSMIFNDFVEIIKRILGLFKIFPLNLFLGGFLLVIGIGIYRSLKHS